MLRRLSWIPALTAVLLALVAGPAAGTASAATEREFLQGYGQLVPLPAPVTPAQQCVERRLFLDAGTYAWSFGTPGGNVPSQDVQLSSGWFRWTICVYPRASVYGATTWLDPETPGQPHLERTTSFDVTFAHTYTWESMLYRWQGIPRPPRTM
ncbi:hypothetical protein ACFVX9_29785 [Kitasatospora sp. NPDC058243]|uniref:hypothetical protein n=1 Tax=Kitasatospora sp. NPDC058243 TaxID=3346397 RepID=UPI0036DCBC81